jgi:GNAT superfamily N-acetyltransferase
MPEMRKGARLTDPGAMLATTHELESGLRVRLRLTKPSDGSRMRKFLRGVSPRSLQLRFGKADPSHVDHRELTFYDPRQRLVVAAAAPGEDSPEEIVGVADVQLLETGLAEIKLLVDDEHQTKGIGTLLSQVIANLAAHRGATHLRASIPEPNPAIVTLMEAIGPTVRVMEEPGTAVYTRLPVGTGRRAA